MSYGDIRIGEPYATNLREVFRAIADQYDGDGEIVNVNRYAARVVTQEYLDRHPERFSHKEGNQITYKSGDSVKSSSVATDNNVEHDDGDPDGDDDTEKMTFTLSEGPPSSDDE